MLLRLAEGSSKKTPSSEVFPSLSTGSLILGRLGTLIVFRLACQDRTGELMSGTQDSRSRHSPVSCQDGRREKDVSEGAKWRGVCIRDGGAEARHCISNLTKYIHQIFYFQNLISTSHSCSNLSLGISIGVSHAAAPYNNATRNNSTFKCKIKHRTDAGHQYAIILTPKGDSAIGQNHSSISRITQHLPIIHDTSHSATVSLTKQLYIPQQPDPYRDS